MKLLSRLCILMVGFTGYSLANLSGNDMDNYYNYLETHPEAKSHLKQVGYEASNALTTDLRDNEYTFTVGKTKMTITRGILAKNTLFIAVTPENYDQLSEHEYMLIKTMATRGFLNRHDKSGNVIEQVNVELHNSDRPVAIFK